jgi:hypothetical protein
LCGRTANSTLRATLATIRTTKGERIGGIVKQRDRSWLSLLAFFTVTTLALSLVLAAVVAGFTVAIAGGGPPQMSEDQSVDPTVPGRTFSGIITDAHCGPRHADSEQSASGCARMCVRNGSKYIMVDGDRNYELAGNPSLLDRLAGERVSLIGVLNGDTIKVSSASPQVATEREQR